MPRWIATLRTPIPCLRNSSPAFLRSGSISASICHLDFSGKGRGKKVIMAIHSFVDGEKPYFKKLSEDEYEKIAGPLIKASIEIAKTQQTSDSLMRYNELEQDSKDFSAFVRYFWTHGRPFEIPIPEDKAN